MSGAFAASVGDQIPSCSGTVAGPRHQVLGYLALMAAAISWTTAIHVFGAGAFMFLWMRQRSLGVQASVFAGALVMFCGAFFPHVFAGHLPQIAAMIWARISLVAARSRPKQGFCATSTATFCDSSRASITR